jgi:hypothetical protein
VDDTPKESLDSNSNSKHELFAINNNSCTSVADVTESNLTDIESLDEAINGGIAPELMLIADLIHGQQKSTGNPKKCRKSKDFKPMVFVTSNTSCGKPKPIQALLNSGASRSLINKKFAKKLKLKMLQLSTNWMTAVGGVKRTNFKCKSQFCIPELEDKTLLEYNLHVTDNLVGYDMILGCNILEDLGIVLDFKEHVTIWGHQQCPFKEHDAAVETSYYVKVEPPVVQQATKQLKKILVAKYKKADPHVIASAQDHLKFDTP